MYPPNSRHMLVIEDNPGDVLLIREGFRATKSPCFLHFAKDGQEALDFMYRIGPQAAAPRPDLILLDLNLPKIHGHDVLADLKSNLEFQSIPIVILTSSASQADIHKAYALAANCYLTKPNDLDDFFSLIRGLHEFWLGLARYPKYEPDGSGGG